MSEYNVKKSAQENILLDSKFLEALRLQMLKFATLQLSDAHLAEDAVQEALVGAMKNVSSFGGRSKQRMVLASSLFSDEEEEDKGMAALFNNNGFWHVHERPANWTDPEQSLHNGDFWRVFEACLEGLPPKQARIFMMREFVELDTEEICTSLELSVTNLHVILHRARLRLRECMENKWFVEGECEC